jgi:hypothetical protein
MVVGLAIIIVSQKIEAKSKRIHVSAEVVQQAFIGDLDNPELGDRRITNVRLFDQDGTNVGTGAGFCTVVSAPPEDTLEECLLTAVFAEGQIIFGGVAPLAEVGAVAQFGILGGTDDFRKARGDAILVVTPSGVIDVSFDLD